MGNITIGLKKTQHCTQDDLHEFRILTKKPKTVWVCASLRGQDIFILDIRYSNANIWQRIKIHNHAEEEMNIVSFILPIILSGTNKQKKKGKNAHQMWLYGMLAYKKISATNDWYRDKQLRFYLTHIHLFGHIGGFNRFVLLINMNSTSKII